jgi:hypothetical protein
VFDKPRQTAWKTADIVEQGVNEPLGYFAQLVDRPLSITLHFYLIFGRAFHTKQSLSFFQRESKEKNGDVSVLIFMTRILF